MKEIEFNPSKPGLHAVLRDWQLKAMRVVWGSSEGVNSRTVHNKVNQVLKGETISRASVIFFLEDMREMGVLRGEERTGKGGYHWVYFPALDEDGFKKFVAKKMIAALMESFPQEAKEVLRNRI